MSSDKKIRGRREESSTADILRLPVSLPGRARAASGITRTPDLDYCRPVSLSRLRSQSSTNGGER
jgi:hypothetical protein